MGEAAPGAITGQPVAEAPLPVVVPGVQNVHLQTSDEFNEKTLPPMWEWNHNPDNTRWSLNERKGFLRLHAGYAEDLYHARNTLTEQMQDEALEFSTRMDLRHMADGDRAGLSVLEKSISYLAVTQTAGQRSIMFTNKGKDASGVPVTGTDVVLRAQINDDIAIYSYSLDGGRTFNTVGDPVQLAFSWWKGARPALFAFNTDRQQAGTGYVDIDWAHYRAMPVQ
jgi:beta-xylosidase